jgi:hypothetical protein
MKTHRSTRPEDSSMTYPAPHPPSPRIGAGAVCPLKATLAALLLFAAPLSLAQKATEMFVPIGQSSGLSGKHTLQGRVQSVNTAERSLTVAQDTTTLTVKVAVTTPVWIDRSKQQQSNSAGTLADAKPGMLAEVKFIKNNRSSGDAEWVKLQSAP